jgi:hypothetical protein
MQSHEPLVELPYEIAIAPTEVRDHYIRMINDGQTPRFAEMCALGAAPAVQGTDDAWMAGRQNGQSFDQMPTRQAQRILREAKAAGISTEGKFYMSGLANSRQHLDAEAWVGSRSDVLRVAKARRLEVKGQVNYTPPEGVAPPQRREGLNPKLVNEMARREMKAEPGLTLAKARQRIREKHTPHWQKKGS